MSEIEKNQDKDALLSALRSRQNQSVSPFLEQINQLDSAPEGAELPNDNSKAAARTALAYLDSIATLPSHLSTTTTSGIGFTFEAGKRFGYAEFLNDGTATFLIDVAGKNRKVWEIENVTNSKILEDSLVRIARHLQGS